MKPKANPFSLVYFKAFSIESYKTNRSFLGEPSKKNILSGHFHKGGVSFVGGGNFMKKSNICGEGTKALGDMSAKNVFWTVPFRKHVKKKLRS